MMTVTDNLPAAAEPSDPNTDPYQALRQQQMDASLALRELLLLTDLPLIQWEIGANLVRVELHDISSSAFYALTGYVFETTYGAAGIRPVMERWAEALGVPLQSEPPTETYHKRKFYVRVLRGGVPVLIWGVIDETPPAAER